MFAGSRIKRQMNGEVCIKMRLFDKRTPLPGRIRKSAGSTGQKFLQETVGKKESILNQKLEEKIPPKLQGTLDAAFAKAFALIFEKGTGVIEKTYQQEKLEQDYQGTTVYGGCKAGFQILASLF